MDDAEKAGEEFAGLVRILDRLRGENGCPWDRQQDEKTIANYFLEESYEVIDSIFKEKPDAVAEELGDMLMEIVFLARLYKEKSDFRMSDVVAGINRKMIRRHPHVFGDDTAADAEEVTASWNRQKNSEKSRESLLDGISSTTPALLTAFQIGLRASVYGFDWPASGDVVAKVKEEVQELEEAAGEKDPHAVMEEIGDLLFVLANLSRHLGVNPEIALQFANRKFITRFRFIEKTLEERGLDLEGATLEEMEELWQLAKKEP
jgi:MazG family protein